MRSSPRTLHRALFRGRPHTSPCLSRSTSTIDSATTGCGRSSTSNADEWAALLAAHRSCHCRDQGGNHGVSDPGARAQGGPARVRRGRSRHGCRCQSRCPVKVLSTAARAVIVRQMWRLIVTHFCPDDLTPFVQEIRITEGHSFQADDATECGTCARRNRGPLRRALRGNEHDCDGGADHQAFDARSVLGTVQGSPLRSARAGARPSGLDGACAQTADGSYVMVDQMVSAHRNGACGGSAQLQQLRQAARSVERSVALLMSGIDATCRSTSSNSVTKSSFVSRCSRHQRSSASKRRCASSSSTTFTVGSIPRQIVPGVHASA